jgi:hypothetical protein
MDKMESAGGNRRSRFAPWHFAKSAGRASPVSRNLQKYREAARLFAQDADRSKFRTERPGRAAALPIGKPFPSGHNLTHFTR